MPKPFSLLQKCSEIRTDGSLCRAVAVKNSPYCRHHLPNHPDELAKITKDGSYAFLKNDEEKTCKADLNSTDEIMVLKATIGILKGRITQLVKEPIEGKALTSLLRTIEQLRKTVETLAKSEEYWEQRGHIEFYEVLNRLIVILKKHIQEEELQEIITDLKEESLKWRQKRQGDGIQQ